MPRVVRLFERFVAAFERAVTVLEQPADVDSDGVWNELLTEKSRESPQIECDVGWELVSGPGQHAKSWFEGGLLGFRRRRRPIRAAWSMPRHRCPRR